MMHKQFLQWILLAGLYSLTMPICQADTLSDSVKFTNPKTDMFSMPADWVNTPVKHPSDIDADLVVTLDQQSYVALKDKINNYARDNHLTIVIKEGTCGLSSGLLEKKVTDIGGFCCPPGKVDRLPGLKFHTLGIAAIALIVHPQNPVENITLQQARDIFSGSIDHWAQLEVKSRSLIKPVTRLHCKKRAGHWKLLLPHEDQFSLHVHDVGVIPDMISKVSKDHSAIGFETLLMIDKYSSIGHVKPLRIDGISPQYRDALVHNAYPLYRTYSVTTWTGKNKNRQADLLVQYLLDTVEDMEAFHLISHKRLREAGWQFHENELIGEPKPIQRTR